MAKNHSFHSKVLYVGAHKLCFLESAKGLIIFSNKYISLWLFVEELKPLLFRVIIKEWLLIPVILLFGHLFLDILQFVCWNCLLLVTQWPLKSVFSSFQIEVFLKASILYSVIFRVINSVTGSLHTGTHTAVTTCTRTIPDQIRKSPSINDKQIIKSHFLVEQLLASGSLWG